MAVIRKGLPVNDEMDKTELILTKITYVHESVKIVDSKIEKLDMRLWQIIILLLSYPLGLMIGKITHIF